MKYWWVNQNQTYQHEVGGGYLWSPKVKSNGHRNPFYDFMREASAGDLVFSFCDTFIKAVGVVTGQCVTSPKPVEFAGAGIQWSEEGWYLPVKFTELARPIRPKDNIDAFRHTLPAKYSPLRSTGDGIQSVYLAPVPDEMAYILSALLGDQVQAIASARTPFDTTADDIQDLLQDRTVAETVRQQLVKARVGQGLFRSNVLRYENACRVTGVNDPDLLIASHIKPWKVSDNEERLAGANGLMLAPHVDRLFDKGYISFANDGSLLVSKKLSESVLKAWSITVPVITKRLSPAQQVFMQYHRDHVFSG